MRRYKRLLDIPYTRDATELTRLLRELARRGVPYKVKLALGSHRVSVSPGDLCFAHTLVMALQSTTPAAPSDTPEAESGKTDQSKKGDYMEIDTFNNFMVGAQNGGIRIMNPPRGVISQLDAMRLAAFLVIMSEPSSTVKFQEILTAMRGGE